MESTYKIIAALLDYPSELTHQIAKEAPALVQECTLLDAAGRQCVLEFTQKYAQKPLLEWQKEYCSMFDVAPSTSLYLFEHVYGSSRKRGAAMCSLKETYQSHGLEISNNELPDYLPVYLDFLSHLDDPDQAKGYLGDIAHILRAIHDVMEKGGSPYALLLEPLLQLAPECAETVNQ